MFCWLTAGFTPSGVVEDTVAPLKHLNVLWDITDHWNTSCIAAFISHAVAKSTNLTQIAIGNGGGDSVDGTPVRETCSCLHPALTPPSRWSGRTRAGRAGTCGDNVVVTRRTSPSTPGCAWGERPLGLAGGRSRSCHPPVGLSESFTANGTPGCCVLTADRRNLFLLFEKGTDASGWGHFVFPT